MSGPQRIQIVWSTAPEGTTHVNPKVGPCAWRRLEGVRWYQWWVDGWLAIPGDHSPEYIARPASWNGQGLPPVGTICQFRTASDGTGWHPELKTGAIVEVIAHFHIGSTPVAAFLFDYDSGSCRQVEQAVDTCFRPLRTPEQIAAEEQREKGVAALCALADEFRGHPGTAFRPFFEHLYDAGYRKVEGGAQ